MLAAAGSFWTANVVHLVNKKRVWMRFWIRGVWKQNKRRDSPNRGLLEFPTMKQQRENKEVSLQSPMLDGLSLDMMSDAWPLKFKQILPKFMLMYQNNSHQLCANRCNEINMWTLCQKSDPTTKCLRSHYKNLANLTELCWRYLQITISFFMQIGVARSIRGPCQKSNARINSSRSQLKILANLSEICWRCLIMTVNYSV